MNEISNVNAQIYLAHIVDTLQCALHNSDLVYLLMNYHEILNIHSLSPENKQSLTFSPTTAISAEFASIGKYLCNT